MNSDARWRPWELERLTLTQLECLISKQPPDVAPEMTSFADFETRRAEAIARRESEEREWYE